ncbi:MAG: hypothetical protein Q9195_008520 [Heterodermia aff. obscurata]
MTKPSKTSFFASKGEKARSSSHTPGDQIKPQAGLTETPTQHQQHHTPMHENTSSGTSGESHLLQDADSTSRIPQGTRVIELRDPVPLASFVVQGLRRSGAKTESYRLTPGVARAGAQGSEKPQAESSSVVPFGTKAVALKEPVPLASFREMSVGGPEERGGKRNRKRRGETERVRIVIGSGH